MPNMPFGGSRQRLFRGRQQSGSSSSNYKSSGSSSGGASSTPASSPPGRRTPYTRPPLAVGSRTRRRQEISIVPIMLVEEFLSVKFVEGPILEGVDLRDRDVIIVDSRAIIKRNVPD